MHSAPAVDALKNGFLAAMGRGVTMVNIVTTDGAAGRSGATVSAMASVSADLAALLVCMNREGTTAQAVVRNGVFCLNVLEESQAPVADSFAGRRVPASGDKFEGAAWSRGATGAWRLQGALAAFDCRVLKADLVGTHYVIVGAAEGVEMRPVGRPLLYGARAYCAAAPLAIP